MSELTSPSLTALPRRGLITVILVLELHRMSLDLLSHYVPKVRLGLDTVWPISSLLSTLIMGVFFRELATLGLVVALFF